MQHRIVCFLWCADVVGELFQAQVGHVGGSLGGGHCFVVVVVLVDVWFSETECGEARVEWEGSAFGSADRNRQIHRRKNLVPGTFILEYS